MSDHVRLRASTGSGLIHVNLHRPLPSLELRNSSRLVSLLHEDRGVRIAAAASEQPLRSGNDRDNRGGWPLCPGICGGLSPGLMASPFLKSASSIEALFIAFVVWFRVLYPSGLLGLRSGWSSTSGGLVDAGFSLLPPRGRKTRGGEGCTSWRSIGSWRSPLSPLFLLLVSHASTRPPEFCRASRVHSSRVRSGYRKIVPTSHRPHLSPASFRAVATCVPTNRGFTL